MKNEFINVLKINNITHFYHFTNIVNLNSILTFGIMNRSCMNDNNIKYSLTDKDRNDNQLGCISLSLSKINKKLLLNKKAKINTEWIIIELDAFKVIEKYYENIFYCKYNASSPSVIKMLNTNKIYMKSLKAFNNIFETSGKINHQAELLINVNIDISYITRIYVEDLNIKILTEKLILDNGISGIDVVIKKEMF